MTNVLYSSQACRTNHTHRMPSECKPHRPLTLVISTQTVHECDKQTDGLTDIP